MVSVWVNAGKSYQKNFPSVTSLKHFPTELLEHRGDARLPAVANLNHEVSRVTTFGPGFSHLRDLYPPPAHTHTHTHTHTLGREREREREGDRERERETERERECV